MGLAELESLLRKLLQKVTPPVAGARPVHSVSDQPVKPVDPVATVGETSLVKLTAVLACWWYHRIVKL